MQKYIAYYRVSTAKQGRSGLGLEAQQAAVREFLNGGYWELTYEFKEVESGKKNDRIVLNEAIKKCRIHNAKLVIAKLDRLSRDAVFLLTLRDSGVDFVCADMPDANRLTVSIMAVIAQDERERISARTKAALAAAKRRGVKLGGDRGNIQNHAQEGAKRSLKVRQKTAMTRANDLKPVIDDITTRGIASLNGIAAELNRMGITTARGGGWQAVQVKRLILVAKNELPSRPGD